MKKLISNSSLAMSSREIADLTGSTHDNVLKTIRAIIEKGVISRNDTPYIPYTHPQNGQVYFEFLLSYRDTMVVVSGYSVELRAKIVDRWQELESKQAIAVPQNFAEALRLAADQQERIQQQEEQLAIAAPKAEFVDRYVDGTGLKGFRQVAKLLGAKENELREFLVDSKIQYRLGGEWCAYQNHIDAGRFQVRTGTSSHSDHVYNEAKFTPKGVAWLAGLWARHNLRNAE